MKQNQINTIQEETRKVTYSDLSSGLKTAIVLFWIAFGIICLSFLVGFIQGLLSGL